MKMGKMLLILVAVSSLLFVQSTQVKALEANGVIEDIAGDVVNIYSGDVINEHEYIEVDNIDIIEIEYEIRDNEIELSMTLQGNIENRGSMGDLDEVENAQSFDINAVFYNFYLEFSDDSLMVTYCNNSARFESFLSGIVNLSESDIILSQNSVTITFDYDTTNQNFSEITADSQFVQINLDDILELNELDEDEWDDVMSMLADNVPNGPLEAYIFIDQDLFETDVTIEFEGYVSGGYPPYSYHWDFSDGSTSTEKTPIHSFDSPGVYEISFVVTDSQGESYSDSYEIEILGEDTQDTPGFGVVIAFIALGFIFWFKKKQ
jgi:PKD repeat protein